VAKADANARSAQFATLWGGKGNWRQAFGLVQIDAALPSDSAVAQVVKAWQDSLDRRLGPERAVATTPVAIDPSQSLSRRQESMLGSLVTDAIRTGTGTDVALLNSGTLRLDEVIPPGPITNHQLESIFPFADQSRIVSFATTGARVRQLLEQSVSDRVFGSGGFLQVSGLSFTFDPAQPSGNRVVGPILRGNGATLEPGDSVKVSFGVYSACRGGDGYKVPEAAAACTRQGSAPRAVDLFVRYLTDSLGGQILAPKDPRVLRAGKTNPG
jgi:2',3'-cyclic-nucleotide 2'-phosphodiesterase (5'-nucleotidase family)